MSLLRSVGFWIFLVLVALGVVGYLWYRSAGTGGIVETVAREALRTTQQVSSLLPLAEDTQKDITAVNAISQKLLATDGVTRTYLVLMQNNFELRPGGGFLGQYGVFKVKDGKVISSYVEDANLLDQRITLKIAPPYPFTRKLQLKRWKMRDSNFSPDFPTNVEKAQYFMRLAGSGVKADAVIAINSSVFDEALKITGPVKVPGFPPTFTSDNGANALETWVEKDFLTAGVAVQDRKLILKKLAPLMIEKLLLAGIPDLVKFGQDQVHNKNIMLYFSDAELQALADERGWTGKMDTTWTGDYISAIDANMGALKSDAYVKRSMNYTVDFTGEKPTSTLQYSYDHTATRGDWKTSDYHSYVRFYVPLGSTIVSRKLLGAQLTDKAFGKTYFGFFVDAVMGRKLDTEVVYTLPDTITEEGYKLLVQKQSGVGSVPLTVTMKRKDGSILTQNLTLERDITLQFTTETVEK